MRELRQQRFRNLSADDRVLKKLPALPLIFGSGNLVIHMTDRIKYLLRRDGLRIETR